ncbi:response regulator [Oharaeibacter diazotrophicus]|uniref:Regulatory protein VirG n=1 Tax=Oharaeibacter diazotrophicus TaxID=1920512 RepID=A0A4R6R7I0_9HYPH|nr:response regulator [Oharaeibacter diazotrophicus]TDP81526.1 two-component system OmpR family response regulator [Oharaeibacter diazotrophicus]BBE73764.1 transcriptional regulatory protein OmpR [Pleomorphomonas sp. SM30]GLS75555.1 DNA-binding response regulator [Oharaeibacter diazotrophicus]
MTDNPHILVVEDDRDIGQLVARYLTTNGCRVSLARDAREMDKVLAASRLDLVVLDVMLPGEDGLSICRRLRARGNLPIIIASARGEEVDRVVGLEVGADDYVPKPYGARELLARIRAVLRRAGEAPLRTVGGNTVHRFRGWRLDAGERSLTSPTGARVTLTPAEFDLLVVFCERPGLVLSRDQLLDLTRGRHAGPFDRSVDILVSRLRRKLGEQDDANFIRTIRSGGYAFTAEIEP